MIGQSISHYQILEKLGEGGMGVVYKAQDLRLDRTVALKFLSPLLTADESERKRFEHEARAVAALDHPNICTFYELGKDDSGKLFIAMAYYEGETVRKKVKDKPLPLSEALEIALGMAQGLSKAHEKGVTHRDIKSENIMIPNDGGVKIMDFGLARIAGASTLTKTGGTVGTVPYMSPEQARGEKADHRSDIWSFGAVLYEMVTGVMPFKSQYNDATVYMILNQNPEPVTSLRTGVPMELERIVSKCLEKKPADRYQHMDDVLVDLRKVRGTSREVERKPRRTASIKWNKWFTIGAAAAIIALFLVFFFPFSKSSDLGIHSIAVLPLENLSRDPEQEYFADGMTEALITDLAKISSLRVISRTSVMRYKATKKTIPEIAKELNVDAVVEGSVQRSGDRVRITAQLLYAPTDRHLWAEGYERNLTDILSLQSELALAISKEIRARVTPQEEARLTNVRVVDKDALDLYLRGRFFLNTLEGENLSRAIGYFRQALNIDPGYASPYAGIGFAYLYLADVYQPPKDAYPLAKAAAEKALSLDSTYADAHAILGGVHFLYDRDFPSAEREFRRAIQLSPNSFGAHQLYSEFLLISGRFDESLNENGQAKRLDPLSPLTSHQREWCLLFARRFDEVIQQHKKTLEMDPNLFYWDSFAGAAYRHKGMYKEALEEYLKAQQLSAGLPIFGLAITHAKMGNMDKARKILDELIELRRKKYVAADWPALIYSNLGDKDRAFEWLNRAYEERSAGLNNLKGSPDYDPIRSDPRFEELIIKVYGEQSDSKTVKANNRQSFQTPKAEASTNWQNSIAVLPFKNISADKEQEYFCDGMTEQIITNLTNLPNVKVIARTSVMQFKNSDKTVPQIALELGVAHILEGSVRKAGNKIRVTAQLIKAADGFHLWAKDYDRQLKDIFAVQDDVSNAIVGALKVKLPGSSMHSMVANAPKNSEAYDLYLRGNFFLRKSDQESLNRALDYFQKSIEKDRSYAPPYAGIAYAYATLADAYLPPKEAYPKAKSAALKALEFDSTIAEARAALAFIFGAYERDQLSSQREFRRAMEFNPNSLDVLWLSAVYLGTRTGSAEAIAQADRAMVLDPLNPFASWTKEYVLYMARQFDQVIEQHKRTVELDPNFFYSDSWVGLAYREKGMLKEALDEYMKVQKLMPGQPLFGLAALYARMGKQQEARNILRDLINDSKKKYVSPTGIAMVYIALGEKDLAFDWLNRAYEAHDTFMNGLKTDVRYNPIRSDPRYAVLLKKMGLEK